MKQLRDRSVYLRWVYLLFITAMSVFMPVQAYAENSLWQALIGGKPTLYVRYRFELVDDDGRIAPPTPENPDPASFGRLALSNNVRTALGYRTGLFYNFGAYFELEDIRQLGPQRFFDGSREEKRGVFPTILDPEGTEVNQAYLSYQGLADTVFKWGRQLILYRPDPLHRFIGNVIWRQNWQTFDAFTIENKSLPDTTFSYAFVWNTNRIWRHDHPMLSDTPMRSHFINIQHNEFTIGGVNVGNLEGYGYLLDNRLEDIAPMPRYSKGDSTKTFGGRIYGQQSITDNWGVLYELEYAHQSPFAEGRDTNRADYVHLQLGGTYKGLTARADYELLSGDGTYGFQTQLATQHIWQGWADRFLITPRDGIQDWYFTLKSTIAAFDFIAVYHRFRSDHLGYRFGDEVDLHAIYHLREDVSFNLRSAHYMGDANPVNVERNAAQNLDRDRTVFWAFLEFKF
jgi:hypothetical protein